MAKQTSERTVTLSSSLKIDEITKTGVVFTSCVKRTLGPVSLFRSVIFEI